MLLEQLRFLSEEDDDVAHAHGRNANIDLLETSTLRKHERRGNQKSRKKK
jgi:hypothetical protein